MSSALVNALQELEAHGHGEGAAQLARKALLAMAQEYGGRLNYLENAERAHRLGQCINPKHKDRHAPLPDCAGWLSDYSRLLLNAPPAQWTQGPGRAPLEVGELRYIPATVSVQLGDTQALLNPRGAWASLPEPEQEEIRGALRARGGDALGALATALAAWRRLRAARLESERDAQSWKERAEREGCEVLELRRQVEQRDAARADLEAALSTMPSSTLTQEAYALRERVKESLAAAGWVRPGGAQSIAQERDEAKAEARREHDRAEAAGAELAGLRGMLEAERARTASLEDVLLDAKAALEKATLPLVVRG